MHSSDLEHNLACLLPPKYHPVIPQIIALFRAVVRDIPPPPVTDATTVEALRTLHDTAITLDDSSVRVGDIIDGSLVAIGKGAQAVQIHVKIEIPPPPPARYQLPAPAEPFVGRERETTNLINHIHTNARQRGTVIRIAGLGGVGKTELATVVANRVAEHYPGGRIWLDMRGSVRGKALQPAQALDKVIRAFRVPQPAATDPDDLRAQYVSLLTEHRVLVVADDALNEDQVRPLLPPVGSALIVTSRRHLTLRNAKNVNLRALPINDAITFLRSSCSRIGTAARRLAKACGQLPFALDIAARTLCAYPMRDIDDYITALQDPQGSTAHHPDSPRSQIDNILRVSYDDLDDTARTVLNHIALFAGSFPLAAAAAVVPPTTAQQVSAALEGLYALSLVEYDEQTQCYDLHELVRSFALQHLRASGDEPAAQSRRAHYALARLQTIRSRYERGGSNVYVALAAFDRERPDISAGWHWARTVRPPTAERDTLQLDYGLAALTIGALRYHPRADRLDQYGDMLEAARRQGKRNREGIALHGLGLAHAALGDYRTALAYFEKNLAITREIGNTRAEGIALDAIGGMYAELGDYATALERHQANLDLSRHLANPKGIMVALGNLGYAYVLQGKPTAALPYLTEQLERAQHAGILYEETIARSISGLAYTRIGNHEQALVWLDGAHQTAIALGVRAIEGRTRDRQGQAYAALEKPHHAIKCYDESLAIAHELADAGAIARTSWRKGELLLQQGNRKAALALLETTVQFYTKIEHAEAERYQAYLARQQ